MVDLFKINCLRRVYYLAGQLLMGILIFFNPAAAEEVAVNNNYSRISSTLLCLEGTQLHRCTWENEPEIIALYFGAEWCAPCHAFTPTLKDIRQHLLDAGARTEVVYVSQDSSEAMMRRYMRHAAMPWPGITPGRLRTLPNVQALAGPAPPNLVLIDREGNVLASAWEGRRYLGLQVVLHYWVNYFSSALPNEGENEDE